MEPSSSPARQAQALSMRLFLHSLGAAELMTMYLGHRLGLYRVLGDGPVTGAELAARAGIGARHATEWLEQQAAAGVVEPAGDGRFRLPEGHRQALTDATSPFAVLSLAVLPVAGLAPMLDRLVEAYAKGEGVGYDEYGEEFRAAQAGMNRPVFTHELPRWIRTALPDVHARLSRPGAVVVDVGCGTGDSSLALAQAYPFATVHGVDLGAAAIDAARDRAASAGLAERVVFTVADVAERPGAERGDLVCVFDALHDMSRPVRVLTAARDLLRPGGCVLLMEPRVGERFTAPAGEVERFMYAVSVLHCLPVGLTGDGDDGGAPAGTGTVMRPDTVRRYAERAGFAATTVLPVEHRFHRLYRLDPPA
ncbi:methyltransferase domain-containing protein [Micromonospora aurantiaca]|uniref:class I SAM-dependent methyltransferase n=1 Tax=Micromonospora aurantiaca (nom. illeg.) TaxID=47850 RepID=UPI003454602B